MKQVLSRVKNPYGDGKSAERIVKILKKIDLNTKLRNKFVEEKLQSKFDFLFGIFLNNNHLGNIKLGPIDWEKGESCSQRISNNSSNTSPSSCGCWPKQNPST